MDAKRNRARELRNNTTDAEKRLWQALRGAAAGGLPLPSPSGYRRLHRGLLCPQAKPIVEIDGGQHAERHAYDRERTANLERLGFCVLRYWNHQVLQQLDDVVVDVHRALTKGFTPPQPSPSPAAKGRE